MTADKFSWRSYVGLLLAVLVGAELVVYLLNNNAGFTVSRGLANFTASVLASFLSARRFVAVHQRNIAGRERTQLTLVFVAISIIAVVAAFLRPLIVLLLDVGLPEFAHGLLAALGDGEPTQIAAFVGIILFVIAFKAWVFDGLLGIIAGWFAKRLPTLPADFSAPPG
jgi:hypothetical protein